MKKLVCYHKGKMMSVDEAGVSVNDLGVQRGYGIFDFLRVSGSVPLFLEDHLDRFFHSASEMHLPVEESRQEIREVIFSLIRENNLKSSGIRLILTGGDSPDGYQIIRPGLVIVQLGIQSPPDTIIEPGIRLLSYPFQRQLPQVKTTDYLMAIWLQPWLKKSGGDDILYYNQGMATECPRSNFFILTKNQVLATPARDMLKGITRKQVIRLAQALGIVVEERAISLDEINTAREMFITSSTRRIVPVRKLDDMIFEHHPQDSVTGKLWRAFYTQEMDLVSMG
jgi:D-alanine transaminase/branched-chain amino acid aminotransferase